MSVCVTLTAATGPRTACAHAGDLAAQRTSVGCVIHKLCRYTNMHKCSSLCSEEHTLTSAIINVEKLCYNPDGSGVTTQLETELSQCSQIPFISLQIMLVCKSAFHFGSVKSVYGQ